MFDNIPLDIHAEIMQRLPVKSLIQFRSVSKSWKSLIDSPCFVNNHHIHQAKTQPERLLFRSVSETGPAFVWLIYDDTFPNHKVSHTFPEISKQISYPDQAQLSSHGGVLFFYGFRPDNRKLMAVIWNPTVRKSMGIVIPNSSWLRGRFTVLGFGICSATSDPKIVKINGYNTPCDRWEVEVFTLSSRAWKSLSITMPFRLCGLREYHVPIKGFTYFIGYDYLNEECKANSNMVIFFDFKSEEFGEVCLPDCLVHCDCMKVFKKNESLVVAGFYKEGEIEVWGAWVMDDVTNLFTKMITLKLALGLRMFEKPKVFAFTKNGQVIMETKDYGDVDDDDNNDVHDYDDDDIIVKGKLEVYEPSSGNKSDIGIKGHYNGFSVTSYTESLFLVDQTDSIIHYDCKV